MLRVYSEQYSVPERCNYCGESNKIIIDHREGKIICTWCATILQSGLIDYKAEWRNEEGERSGKERVGGASNSLLEGQGMQTLITPSSSCSAGSSKLERYHNQATGLSGKDSTRIKVFRLIKEREEALNFSKYIRDSAQELFVLYQEKTSSRRSLEAVVDALIYLAYKRDESHSRVSLVDILRSSGNKRRDVVKCYMEMSRLFKHSTTSTHHYLSLLPPIINKLNLPYKYLTRITQIVNLIVGNEDLEGKQPSTIAALGVYIFSRENPLVPLTLKDIAQAANVTAATIKKAAAFLATH